MSETNKLKQKSNSKIKIIFDNGKKVVTGNFIAFFILSEQFEAVIIASKKIGNAVKRNRSKRRLREMVRLNIKNQVQPIKLILLARNKTALSEYQSLIEDCNTLINKINKTNLREQ